MTERIIITETEDPRSKRFAVSKKFANFYTGTYKRNGGKIELTYLSNGISTVYKDWNDTTKPYTEVAFRLMDFAEVGTVEFLGDSQICITLSPAYFWTDLNDGVSIFDHMIETLRHMQFNDVEPEIVMEGLSNADVRVFTGAASSNLFILNRPIVADSEEVAITEGADGSITGDAFVDPRVYAIARAILLHPNLAGVRMRGQFVRIDAATLDAGVLVPADVTPDARAYALGVMRVAVYEDKRITVHYSNTAEQPATTQS
jgi:hypothetical protein